MPKSIRSIDTIIVPGGPPADGMLANKKLVAWLAKHGAAARRICSVCSGAFLLAEAGFLDGKRATTHWQECGSLQRRYPSVEVSDNAIYVQDDRVWTSAGVTAGIDLALALVKEDCGHELAMRVARQLVVFLKRPGGQSQFSTILEAQSADGDTFAELHRWLLERLDDPHITVDSLAEKACMSLRNFARVYKSKTGRTPAKAIELFRLEEARRLLGDTDCRIETVARRTGFGDEERMRTTFQRHLGISPRQYRERFGR
jgi:transcriptional regulator GlxA family with amidase domain